MSADHSFARAVLLWYRKHGRDLPWRRTKDPYAIWLSEVMLQQTQVSRVEEYYRRFLKRFPTIESLAAAQWRQVLPVWRGLGYYQRGRNLIATARTVCTEHGGRFPNDDRKLRALPGIGPYTARAIRSFAFHEPVAALDTNLTRVLGRHFGCTGDELKTRGDSLFAASASNAAELNHALMDLGAALCTSRIARCDACPASKSCRSRGMVAVSKKKSAPKRNTKAVDVGAACIHRNGKYLLARRPAQKGGEWEFPGGKREPGEDIRACLKREIREELGIEIAVRPPFHISHSRHPEARYRIHFCRSQILKGRPKAFEHEELAWFRADELEVLSLAPSNIPAAKILGRRKSMRSTV